MGVYKEYLVRFFDIIVYLVSLASYSQYKLWEALSMKSLSPINLYSVLICLQNINLPGPP